MGKCWDSKAPLFSMERFLFCYFLNLLKTISEFSLGAMMKKLSKMLSCLSSRTRIREEE